MKRCRRPNLSDIKAGNARLAKQYLLFGEELAGLFILKSTWHRTTGGFSQIYAFIMAESVFGRARARVSDTWILHFEFVSAAHRLKVQDLDHVHLLTCCDRHRESLNKPFTLSIL